MNLLIFFILNLSSPPQIQKTVVGLVSVAVSGLVMLTRGWTYESFQNYSADQLLFAPSLFRRVTM